MTKIAIRALTPAIGAELSGVDVLPLSADAVDTIRATLINRKVLVFRDLNVAPAQYADFMSIFGDAVREDLVIEDGNPAEVGVLHIRPDEQQQINYWHMDHSFRDLPTPVLSLHAQKLPPCGGDTLFASLEAAYDGLSDAMKERVAGLHALHKATPTQNMRRRYTQEQIDERDKAPPVRHPLVGLNPHNGRKFLFVNTLHFCHGIDEMRNDEGDRLLRELYLHVQQPEFHCRVCWAPKTLVVWENVHCLHYPVADYFPYERKMLRVVIKATEGLVPA